MDGDWRIWRLVRWKSNFFKEVTESSQHNQEKIKKKKKIFVQILWYGSAPPCGGTAYLKSRREKVNLKHENWRGFTELLCEWLHIPILRWHLIFDSRMTAALELKLHIKRTKFGFWELCVLLITNLQIW